MKNRSLECLSRIGFKLFLKALRNDCAAYLGDEYGVNWTSVARDAWGSPTKLGQDIAAIRNIIWHATHTNWFEYKAGSRLTFFRFPVCYRKLARDGVPVFFEKTGPSSHSAQP